MILNDKTCHRIKTSDAHEDKHSNCEFVKLLLLELVKGIYDSCVFKQQFKLLFDKHQIMWVGLLFCCLAHFVHLFILFKFIMVFNFRELFCTPSTMRMRMNGTPFENHCYFICFILLYFIFVCTSAQDDRRGLKKGSF